MAKPSQLEGRVLAILDGARTRCAPSASMRASLVAAMIVVAVPFGALRLAAQVSPSPDVSADVVVARQAVPAIGVVMHRQADADAVAAVRDERFANVAIVRADMADVDLIEPHPVEVFIEALEARNKMAGPAAEKAFKDATSHIKWTTIEGLGMKGIPATVAAAMQGQPASAVSDETRRRVADALISALNDENPQVRQEALTSLASMRDERAIPGLVRALNDPTTEVRMRALSALSQFNTTPAADGVLTALKDRTPQVREMAARQLANLMSRGQLRDQKYADALSGLLKDDNAAVRANAARALGQLGNTDAVTALTPLLRDADKNVREQAADALGDLADPRAIDALTAALKDTEPEVREQAARALGRIARGQRRTARPSPVPVPPLPPRVSLDQDRIREIEERAREAAERARDAAFRLRDFDFNFDFDLFNRFDAPVPPVPPAAPAAPAAPAPPAPPR